MPISNTFVGMVDRDAFDPWLARNALKKMALTYILASLKGSIMMTAGLFTLPLNRNKAREGYKQSPHDVSLVLTALDLQWVSKQSPALRSCNGVMAYHEIVEAPQAPASEALQS